MGPVSMTIDAILLEERQQAKLVTRGHWWQRSLPVPGLFGSADAAGSPDGVDPAAVESPVCKNPVTPSRIAPARAAAAIDCREVQEFLIVFAACR